MTTSILPAITGAVNEVAAEMIADIRTRKLSGMQAFAAQLRSQVGSDPVRAQTMEQVEDAIYQISQISESTFWTAADSKRADQIIAGYLR